MIPREFRSRGRGCIRDTILRGASAGGGSNAEKSHLPLWKASAMRKKWGVPAARTPCRRGDSLRRDPLGAGALCKSPPEIDRCRARRLGQPERTMHLRTHLVAPTAYGRPEVHQEIPRIRRTAVEQCSESRLEDSRRHAAPAAMQQSNGPALRIHDEDRNTVRNRNRKQDIGIRRHMAVAAVGDEQSGNARIMVLDLGAVNLARVYDAAEPEGSAQTPPPLQHASGG